MIARTFILALPAASLALALPAVAGSSSAAPAANDSSTQIHESQHSMFAGQKFLDFAVNAELGRAWVEVMIVPAAPEEPPEILRIQVPGLAFDAASRQVLYRSGGRVTECARVSERGIGPLKRLAVEPTGRCALSAKYVEVPRDDGFEIRHAPRFQVQLTPVS